MIGCKPVVLDIFAIIVELDTKNSIQTEFKHN